ncbi:uncharacterized protein LOC135847459 isoform X1 [Planococcus citri]|uniref:uncharacterized protein LOC135847459 isoform X1 n=1 Tax=Planococcus citri TaxID=170843 RepID=UPI0031F77726
MEVEMNMELEMAEVRPRVYDVLHPTPVSLKQLSTIVASFEIWRYEINTHRTRNTSKLTTSCCKWPHWERLVYKTTLANVPRVINDLVEKYIYKFDRSKQKWFTDHTAFRSYKCPKNCILNDFDDFVTDFKGDVDYVRTAERMMSCDRLDDTVKFEIACLYCFEDDIRRIWPSVRETITSRDVNSFSYFGLHLPYWIGTLTNQLEKTDAFEVDLATTYETMFDVCSNSTNRSLMEYFWNLMRPENRLEKAMDLLNYYDTCLARFILPRLDDQQLGEFVDEFGCILMSDLLECQIDDGKGIVIIPTWMYIRNYMNEKQFLKLSIYMLLSFLASYDDDDNRLFYCREIWDNSPHNLKQSAARTILSSTELINKLVSRLKNDGIESTPKFVKLLLNMLPSATFDERSSFWNNCWHQLIVVVRCEYLQRFIKLCFGNEDDITKFKANVMANSEHLRQLCISLVNDVNFDKLKDLLKFCYPEVQQARNFNQELLQLALLGEDCQFSKDIVQHANVLNHFINKTYDGADLSVEFKSKLMMSPAFEKFTSLRVCSNDFCDLFEIKKFVEEFELTEPTLVQIKTRIIDSFNESLTGDGSSRDLLKKSSLNYFLSWCLGNDAEVEEFRRKHALIVVKEDEDW